MFEFIRSHRRLMQFFLMLLIIPSFAFVGLEGYTSFRSSEDEVAKVAGKTITQQDWDNAQREQLDRFRQMFGGKFDPKMFETPEAKRNVLENLIAERSLNAEAQARNLTVTDQNLQKSILGIQGLTLPDGKFDIERYKSLLAAQNMTPAMFEARQRQDMVMQQINSAVQNTAFAPKALAVRLLEINDQQREVQQLSFKVADKLALVKPTDAMLKDWYTKNIAQFEIPETVKAEYVVLTNDHAASKVVVSEADAKSYYDKNPQRFIVEEQRRASHILLNLKKDASAADQAAVKAKAEGVLAKVNKNPADFAALAKEHSQDTGTAERGGDLDFFGKGSMVKAFDEAVFKLKQGEISGLVQSEFGYHIIQLTGIHPTAAKTFDESKLEIEAEIKKQLLPKKFSELAELLNNTAYEQADSLKPVAEKLGLKIETVAAIGRSGTPLAARNAPFNQAKFLTALFSDEALKNRRNTEAVEVSPGTMIVGHVMEHKPSTKRPFEEVKPMVEIAVAQAEAAKLAAKEGEARLAALKAKDDTAGFSEPVLVSRAKGEAMSGDALAAVMRADTSKLPAYVGLSEPGVGYSVYRIGKVAQPTAAADEARRTAEQTQAASNLAQQEMHFYIEFLKQKAKAKIVKQSALVVAANKDGGAAGVK